MTKDELTRMMSLKYALRICRHIASPEVSELEKERAVEKMMDSVTLQNQLRKTELMQVIQWIYRRHVK